MNIFGYFPLFQSFTFCKSTSDIKKIQNKMAATQVALLLLSSILLFSQECLLLKLQISLNDF